MPKLLKSSRKRPLVSSVCNRNTKNKKKDLAKERKKIYGYWINFIFLKYIRRIDNGINRDIFGVLIVQQIRQ